MSPWVLKYFYDGGIKEETFLDDASAIDEAISRLKNGVGTPIHIRHGDEVKLNYFDIIAIYKTRQVRPQ